MPNVGEKIAGWLADAAKDVATLQVETYKVKITANVTTNGTVPLDEFMDNLSVNVDSGTCKVVMVSKAKIDHDTVVLYTEEMTEDDERFVTHHREIFEAAASARSEVVRLALNFARGADVT